MPSVHKHQMAPRIRAKGLRCSKLLEKHLLQVRCSWSHTQTCTAGRLHEALYLQVPRPHTLCCRRFAEPWHSGGTGVVNPARPQTCPDTVMS